MTELNKIKVVYSGPEHCIEQAKSILGARFILERVEPIHASLAPAFSQCDVFLDASMKVNISNEMIEAADSLKLIVTATTGATHIVQNALEIRNVPLLTLKGQTQILHNLTPAAEHTWALLMACARQLPAANQHVSDGEWERTLFPGLMLKDKTIGLIGLGRIGRWMSRYAHAFDMNIQYYDPYVTDFPEYAEKVSLEELVASSDIISIHVHVNDETEGMLNRELIEQFKLGCIFLNTSRSDLTDEIALVEALKQGKIASVGVDVLQGEPEIQNNPLWQYAQKHQNVIITPHIGGFCPDAVTKVVEFSCQRIVDYFQS